MARCSRSWKLALGAAFAASIAWLLTTAGAPVTAQPGDRDDVVLAGRVDDPITPIIADHVIELVDQAEADDYEALVIELDTPGGLDTAMRDIVQRFLAAEVPVIAYVSPSGARAASAGAFIAWSAHLVAMAPGTTIGAATPVDLEGGEVGDKVVNDAAAYARALAEERGRNVDVAAEAVTEGRALSSDEAVEAGVADLIADGRTELLEALDGTLVRMPNGEDVSLDTAGATVDEREMSLFRSLLQRLADPNLAFLLLSLGTLGIIYELATPGIGVGGGLGAVLIVLALVSLAVLPVDAVGFVFLAVAVALFAAELFAPGVGAAAVLGSVALALAGIFLFRDEAPGLSLSLAAIIPTVSVVGLGVAIAGRLALHARSATPATGAAALVGQEITVATAPARDQAQGWVAGAWWTLRSDDRLEPGDHVTVRDIDGLDLVVDRTPPSEKENTS